MQLPNIQVIDDRPDEEELMIDVYAVYDSILELYTSGEFVTLYQDNDLAGIYFDVGDEYNMFYVVDDEIRMPNYFVINTKTNKVEAALSTELDLKQYIEHFGSLAKQQQAGFISPLKDASTSH